MKQTAAVLLPLGTRHRKQACQQADVKLGELAVWLNGHERSLPGARGAKPPMSPDNNKMFTEELQRTHAERESES